MRKILLIIYIVLISFSHTELYSQKSSTEISGDILSIGIPVFAFASTIVHHDDNYKGTLQFAKSLGLAMVTSYSLKYIINKKRPNGGDYSFPSGHTMSSFTGAAFLERRYGWKVGIPAYITAAYVGWTRIKAKKHDYWDVLGGAVIGTASAYLFTTPYLKKNAQISVSKTDDSYRLNVIVVF